MAKRKKSKTRFRIRRRKGVTFTDDQKLQLLAAANIDDETKKKILKA